MLVLSLNLELGYFMSSFGFVECGLEMSGKMGAACATRILTMLMFCGVLLSVQELLNVNR